MSALAMVIAVACALWAVDRYQFRGRDSDNLLRAAQNKAQLPNYEVKRWFNPISR